MPTLGNALDFSKYEARNLRAHILGSAPSSPVTGQLYYSSADNTLYWWDGSAWVSARGGASATPPATTGALGTVQLAGDLAGTATSPQIAAGVITDAEVAAANKDGALLTPSLRTIGGGTAQARSGGDSLDKLAIPNLTEADWPNNNKKITELADPTAATDAANKKYVDGVAQGLDTKQSVKVATTASITLSGTQTIDGVGVSAGDRVLVKNQGGTAGNVANGIYIVAAGAWTRATDADTPPELESAFVFVDRGTTQADSGWVCTNDIPFIIGTDQIYWVQFSGAGQVTSGAGLTKTGNTLDVGQGNGIQVQADTVGIASGGVVDGMIASGNLDPNKLMSAVPLGKGGTGAASASTARISLGVPALPYTAQVPASPATTVTILQSVHLQRAQRGLVVQVQDEATGAVELPDVVVNAGGDVTVTWGATVSTATKRVTIFG